MPEKWKGHLQKAIATDAWDEVARRLMAHAAPPTSDTMHGVLSSCLCGLVGAGDLDGAKSLADRLPVSAAVAAWRDAARVHPQHDGPILLHLLGLASQDTAEVAVQCAHGMVQVAESGQEDWRLAEAVPVFMSLVDALLASLPADWRADVRAVVVPALGRWGSFDLAFEMLSHLTFPDDALYAGLAREQARRGVFDLALETVDWMRESSQWLRTRCEIMIQCQTEEAVIAFVEDNPRLAMPGRAVFVLDAVYGTLADLARRTRRSILAERYSESIRNVQQRAQAQVSVRAGSQGVEGVLPLVGDLGPLVKPLALGSAIRILCEKGDRSGAAVLAELLAEGHRDGPTVEILQACCRCGDVPVAERVFALPDVAHSPQAAGLAGATLVKGGQGDTAVAFVQQHPASATAVIQALLEVDHKAGLRQLLPTAPDPWSTVRHLVDQHPDHAAAVANLLL